MRSSTCFLSRAQVMSSSVWKASFLGVGEIAGFGEDDNPLQKGRLYPYNGRTEACRAKWELPLNKHQVADDAVGDKDTCMAEAQVLVFRFQFAASYVRFGGVYAMLP